MKKARSSRSGSAVWYWMPCSSINSRSTAAYRGVREENTLEAVLARPRLRWHYEPESDLATLAAAYGWDIVTSHPYRDGNKRITFLAIAIFLGLNRYEFETSQDDVVTVMLTAAAGQFTESQMADWVRTRLVPPA